MVAPIDYTLNVKSPFESAIQGVQLGAGLADLQARRQKAQVEAQAAQQEIERQRMVSQQVMGLMNNPNPTVRDFTNVAMLLPEKEAASMRQNWELLEKTKQQGAMNTAGQVLAAFQSGNNDIGVNLLKERATAARNSGDEENAKAFETWAQIAEVNPKAAQTAIGTMVALVPGGDKVLDGVYKAGKERREQEIQPFEVTKAQADAQKAATEAKFAESEAVLDLEKRGWDIKKIQEDIKIAKMNSQIAAANSAIARAGNDIKRQELSLKAQELIDKRDATIREKSAEVESARSNMDNMLNTADRILNTPMGVVGSAAGPVSSRMPTLTQSTADFEALVETLGSQSFLAQIPNIKGMGALSNAEGEKLQAALQNFNLKQSPERLMENVREAQRLILKGRQNLARRYGVPESIPDTPAATSVGSAGKTTDQILKELGVR